MPKIFKSKFFTTLLISALVLPCLLAVPVVANGTYPYSASDDEVADALDYLRGEQISDGSIGTFLDSAWVVMAIAAAGEDPHDWQDGSNSIVDYLADEADSAESATDYARMILAIAAADEDPTDFGGRNFLALLEAEYDGVQIGSASLLNDDFWGVMALIAAGRAPSSTIIQDSLDFILAKQNTDGGWGYAPAAESDVDDTAAAIMALIAAGESPSLTAIADALDYMKSTQMDNGGFESWGSTNADTDSSGIQAIVAAGEDPTDADWESGEGKDPVDDLLTFQQEDGDDDGAFYWQIDNPGAWPTQTTAKAIIALLGEYHPVAVLPLQEGVTVNVRIEGESNTIWSGRVTVAESTIIDDDGNEHNYEQPTALGALEEASQAGDFSYTVRDFGWGLAITAIDGAGDWDSGPWWMFIVDGASAQVGADAFILNETSPPDPPHAEVLFSFTNTFSEIPLKVEVDNAEPDVDEPFTVTVTEYDEANDEWLPTEEATVYADQDYTTDEDGEVEIIIDRDLTVKVYAEKEGYIRSNRVTVTVGEGSAQADESENVSLTADIMPAISFSVSPDSINFGELGPRDTSEPVEFELINDGTWELSITAVVTDDAEGLYVNGLKLDNEKWDEFKTDIERDRSKDYQATLTVPETYTLTGSQSGTLIFWASEVP
jgi:hypothetical protein